MAREIEFYADSKGFSDAADALRRINEDDPRHRHHIQNKLGLAAQIEDLDRDGTRNGLVKRPSAYIYVLIVRGSGGFGFRLPFFLSDCKGGERIVVTHCAKRRDLNSDTYADLVEEAEERRLDWIERHCERRSNARR